MGNGPLAPPLLSGAEPLPPLPHRAVSSRPTWSTLLGRRTTNANCGASFRLKGSLIRHHRRHTGEPASACCRWPGARLLGFVAPDSWRCEAGADTTLSADSAISVPSVGRASGSQGTDRHLKSLTPCTEKISQHEQRCGRRQEDVPAGQPGGLSGGPGCSRYTPCSMSSWALLILP